MTHSDLFHKMVRFISNVGLGLAAIVLGAILVMQVGEVVMRYFFGTPTSWIKDSAGYLLLVAVFLVFPSVTRTGQHVSIDFLLGSATPPTKEVWATAISWFCAALCLCTGLLAALEAGKQIEREVLTVAAFTIPKWWLTGFIAFGFGGSALNFVVRALDRTAYDGSGRI